MTLHQKILTLALILTAAPTWVCAQQPLGNDILVRIHVVDRDQIDQWEGLMLERMESLRATEQGYRHIYQQIRGNLETFIIITPYDGPIFPVSENWQNALNDVLTSSELLTLQSYPAAFTRDLQGDVAVPSEFMYVRERTVPPGMHDDYLAWQRDELIPALREAEFGDVRTLRVVHGGDINTWVRYYFINDIPRLGDPNPLVATMGERAFEQLVAEGDAMTTSAADHIYRFRGDLSYD